jgi:hypothetical protein
VDSELSPQEGQEHGLSPTEPGATPAGDSASPSPAHSDPGLTQPGAVYPGDAGPPTGGADSGSAQQPTWSGYPGAAGQPTSSAHPGPGQSPPVGYPGVAGQSAGGAYPGSAGRPASPGYYPPAQPPAGSQPPYPYNPPYPYPGQTPPGSPGGPAGAPNVLWPGAPPARPKRRRGLLLALTAAVAVVVGAAATGVVLLLGKSESPTTMALQSGQAIALAKGLTLTGTIAGQNASLAVTRAGTVEGSYSQSGNPVTRITINDATYIKAPTAFWKSVVIDPLAAQQAGGNWAKALGGAIIMTFDSLTPGQVAHVLEHVGDNPRVVNTTLGGTKVIKLIAHGTSYYITTSTPNRLVRIVGRSGPTPYSFNVTSLTAATISPVFTILHGDVQGLQGAVDPEAIVDPLQKIRFHSDCNGVSSCTVSSKVSVTDPATPKMWLKMTVDFSGTKNGAAFASCSDTVPVATGGTVAPACGLHGSVWTGWVNSHTSNFFTWADPHFETTVNSASDIVTLQSELNQQQRA